MSFFLFLDDGNQTERIIAPTLERTRLKEIQSQYKWTRFDEYDNRMWEYMYALHDPVLKQAGVKQLSLRQLWRKFNRAQKAFYTFLAFSGQTDNGGVWQFLFNCPELAVAALEAFGEIDAVRLATDYRGTLEEVLGKAKSIADLRRRATQAAPTAEKWAAFAEGYQTPEKIESYFYTKKFKKEVYRRMCDYIEERIDMFASIPEH